MPAHAFKWPKQLIMGTPAVGTSANAMTVAIASILGKDTGMRIRVIPDGNTPMLMTRFIKGDFDIVSLSTANMEASIAGRMGHADKPRHHFRILWHQNDTPWMFAAPGNSKLTSIFDIKKTPGTKLAVCSISPAMIATVKGGLLDFLGISEKDVIFVPIGSYPGSVRSIVEGKADVALISPISAVTHEIAASPVGIKWLDLPLTDTEGWKKFIPYRPTGIPGKITWGIKSAIGHDGYYSNFLYSVGSNTDPELVYNLAKWFHTKFDLYSPSHKSAKRMHIDFFRPFLDRCSMPVHLSTVKYLKEIGKWTAKDDKWNGEAIKTVSAYIKAFDAATAEAKSKGIKISTKNKKWMDLWDGHKKDIKPMLTRMD
ncbi:TAXI family TRAP transporter solute-binding subunit [Thermodesulfobacteriota bacterium]